MRSLEKEARQGHIVSVSRCRPIQMPTLDELYERLRDCDYTQVDERLAVMLNAILQLESQRECKESVTEAVLMVGYTLDGISNLEQTRWLS